MARGIKKQKQDEAVKQPTPSIELGVVGVRISGGYVDDEFEPQLRGQRGRKKYREMQDTDPTIGAVKAGITQLLMTAPWTIKSNPLDSQQIGAAFLESVKDDMSHTWEDFISEVLTFPFWGFNVHEIVWKLRQGPDAANPWQRSKYDDGNVGIRKLAHRAQETIEKWAVDENGGIQGVYQIDPNSGKQIFIPIEKMLLFRPQSSKNNPEGRSILRNAFRPYRMLRDIENYEAIGIERDLTGLPAVKIPSSVIKANGPELQEFVKTVRDLRNNNQGGLVLPSDTYKTEDGQITNVPKVQFELLASPGSKVTDTSQVTQKYETSIARSMLADFMFLGSSGGTGSFALSKDKSKLFYAACEAFLSSACEVLNRHLIPRLWRMNGFDDDTRPEFAYGSIAPIDLAELSDYVSKLSLAGIPIGAMPGVTEYLLEAAGLPAEPVATKPLQTAPPEETDAA